MICRSHVFCCIGGQGHQTRTVVVREQRLAGKDDEKTCFSQVDRYCLGAAHQIDQPYLSPPHNLPRRVHQGSTTGPRRCVSPPRRTTAYHGSALETLLEEVEVVVSPRIRVAGVPPSGRLQHLGRQQDSTGLHETARDCLSRHSVGGEAYSTFVLPSDPFRFPIVGHCYTVTLSDMITS